MITLLYTLLVGAASLVAAFPVNEKRVVTELNQNAFEEAQQRDATATRAFSSVPIKTSQGQCLFVVELSGDFRANLTPIQVAACDGSAGQLWDVVTAGKHNDQLGSMLIINTLTQACFNFDPRRAAGNQVLLFSCGGRADGSGEVQPAQLFPFTGSAGPLNLSPESAPETCLTVKEAVIDQAACNAADPNQSFVFGDTAVAATSVAPAAPTSAIVAVTNECGNTLPQSSALADFVPSPAVQTIAAAVVEATLSPTITSPASSASTATTASASTISVSRAGLVLNPSAVAEANPRDDTATRAFSSVTLKSASGMCLFIDPTAGDFRENLIPIVLAPCDGTDNQKWDVITSGKHNDKPNSALLVSALTQGCMNFDPRRAAADTVMMFSCGGRADGGGVVTNSQLFPFTAGETSLRLQPENGAGSVCLVPNAAGRLDQAACSDDAGQFFSIV